MAEKDKERAAALTAKAEEDKEAVHQKVQEGKAGALKKRKEDKADKKRKENKAEALKRREEDKAAATLENLAAAHAEADSSVDGKAGPGAEDFGMSFDKAIGGLRL